MHVRVNGAWKLAAALLVLCTLSASAETEEQLRTQLRAAIADNGGLTLSQIREILETTRKYAVPLCEYLDRIGFTKRKGDFRVLAETHS